MDIYAGDAMSTPTNPIRLFVTHNWQGNDDLSRVFEYLESSRNFHYKSTTQEQAARPLGSEAQREDLRRQIAPSEVLIVLPATYRMEPDLVLFQMNFAKAANRPIIAMENFGSSEPLPKPIVDLADEVCPWNERSLVDALRRQARHEDTHRWDTIEFKID
ncbi:MAG: hypothetical protein ACHQIL_03865 [Steroidobacterales bacterium]